LADLFPFPTWTKFEAEFCLRFVEENEQDQALTKLESRSYFQGSRDICWYTDDFEELAITAGYLDALVWVTKHRSGLDPKINIAITTSGTTPNLTDYDSWHAHAFWQYKAFACALTLRLGFQPPFLVCTQRAYFRFRLWFPHALRSCSPRSRRPRFRRSFRWMLTRLRCAHSHAPASDAVQLDTSPRNAQLRLTSST
jgi:hypothetical protein